MGAVSGLQKITVILSTNSVMCPKKGGLGDARDGLVGGILHPCVKYEDVDVPRERQLLTVVKPREHYQALVCKSGQSNSIWREIVSVLL